MKNGRKCSSRTSAHCTRNRRNEIDPNGSSENVEEIKKKTLFSFNLEASFQSVCAKMQFEALIYWPDNERSSITRTKAHPSADFAENHLIHSLATSAIWWSIWFWWWIFFFKWKQLDWTSAVAVLPASSAPLGIEIE